MTTDPIAVSPAQTPRPIATLEWRDKLRFIGLIRDVDLDGRPYWETIELLQFSGGNVLNCNSGNNTHLFKHLTHWMPLPALEGVDMNEPDVPDAVLQAMEYDPAGLPDAVAAAWDTPAPTCLYCDEPVSANDIQWTPAAKADRSVGMRAIHPACQLRAIVGGLNHLRGLCTCCGGTEDPDPPGMTRYEAAVAAAAYYRRLWVS